jgi:hypothetical protein
LVFDPKTFAGSLEPPSLGRWRRAMSPMERSEAILTSRARPATSSIIAAHLPKFRARVTSVGAA